MAKINAQILYAKVMHRRLMPKINGFTYKVYYIHLPLDQEFDHQISHNKLDLSSFHDKDHGYKSKGASLRKWAEDILETHGQEKPDSISLICMPRILGYVFNPVSFWLCRDQEGILRSVLCEVNNTFGESHTYLCAHHDQSPITEQCWIEAQKLFHVSPFIEREGSYKFRFDISAQNCIININLHNPEGEKLLLTAINGTYQPLTKQSLRQAFLTHPLVTIKVIALIHYQALKLLIKGVKFITKPRQMDIKNSSK